MNILGIVTVVRNEKDNLSDFYNSLVSQTFKDFILYLVDNNSADGSRQFFEQLNKDEKLKVSYISLDCNAGFAVGSNIGAKAAINDSCKYLFILNNDVVMDSTCLQELTALIESDKSIAAVGPLLFRHQKDFPNTIQEFGGKINFKKGELQKFFENRNINEVTLPEKLETDFIGGGVCFIRAEIFEKVSMFEEKYFGYFDEIDLSYRLKVLNQYRMFVTSKAVGYHNHRASKKNKANYYFEYYLSERNKFLYYKKFGLRSSIIYAMMIDLLKFPRRLLWFVKVCDFKLGIYYLKGMKDGLLGKSGKPSFV